MTATETQRLGSLYQQKLAALAEPARLGRARSIRLNPTRNFLRY